MPPTRSAAGFDDAYLGTPPWDIGAPQPEILALADAGHIAPPVLDVGCGTGENALELASRGLQITGIDGSPRAIGKALEKARERGLTPDFLVADALLLGTLHRTFRTAIDSGLFHVFDDLERRVFAASLALVLEPGGRYHLICFSELEPGGWGPRRVTQDEIRATFDDDPWHVEEIVETGFATNLEQGAVRAWRATIERR